jgi:hypothetical protein
MPLDRTIRHMAYGDWLDQRVSHAFGDRVRGQAAAASFLVELRQNWREAEKTQDRSFFAIVAGMVIFELAIRGDIAEASFSFVKLKSLGFLGPVLPVIVAYLYYQMCSLRTLTTSLLTVHDTILDAYFPERQSCGVEAALHPPSLTTGNSSDLPLRPGGGALARLIGPWVGGIVWFLVPPIFLVYAFVQLFRIHPVASPLIWASLSMALLLVLFAILETVSGASRF